MKTETIKLRSSFTAQNPEQIRKAVTRKVEKIVNEKLKNAG